MFYNSKMIKKIIFIFSVFFLSSVTVYGAADYMASYQGGNQRVYWHYETVYPGNYSFEVDGSPSCKAAWYRNNGFVDKTSHFYDDPDYSFSFTAGTTTQIEASLLSYYVEDWLESHIWVVTCVATPSLYRSPSSLNFYSSTTQKTFRVKNNGGGTLTYSISDNKSWISCSPTSGSSTGEYDTITVTVNRSGLSPGSYSGTVTIDPSHGSNQTVSVSMSVLNDPPTVTRYDPTSRDHTISKGTNMTFKALGTDSDGKVAYADWTLSGPENDTDHDSFIDTTSKISTYSHTFNTAGSYKLTCEFTDNNGATDNTYWNIYVQEASITDGRIKSGTFTDLDDDGYASALTIEWDCEVNFGTMSVYANIQADSWNRTQRDLGNTSSFTLGTSTITRSFVIPVQSKNLDHTTWDFQIDLYKTGTTERVARLSMGSDPQLNDVKIELLSEETQIANITDGRIKSGTFTDIDGDGYASALTIEWDSKVNYGSMSVYANVQADSINRTQRDLGNTSSFTLGTSTITRSFVIPVQSKNLDHTTWDFQVDLYKTGTTERVARLSMGSDPQLNDVKIELPSEDAPLELTTTLRNYENRDLPAGGTPRFWLYHTSPPEEKYGSPAIFENATQGTYLLEGYFNGNTPFNVYELWNSEQVTIGQNPNSHTLVRKYPFTYEVEIWDNTRQERINPGDTVPLYTTVAFKVYVRSDLDNTPLDSLVHFWIDSDNDGIADLKLESPQAQQVPTVSGQHQLFTFAFATTEPGQIRYAPAVYTHLANGSWEWTDSWKWTSACSVVDVPDLRITQPWAGQQLKIDDEMTVEWDSSGSVGDTVKFELIQFPGTVKENICYAQEVANDINGGVFQWYPKQEVPDPVTGPYYQIKISSVDKPDVEDSSDIFGLYTKDYGITVITHGWTAGSNRPKWPDNLASAIIERAGKGIAFEYIPDTGKWNYLGNTYLHDGSNWGWNDNALKMPSNVDDGEIVLIFDWAAESAITAGRGGYGYSEAAGDAMFASLKASLFEYTQGYSRPDYNNVDLFHFMHFIGHSRGNVVNSMAIRRIAEYMPDFDVEHVTLLDPHPVDGADPSRSGDPYGFGIYLWDNVQWADCYWRRDSFHRESWELDDDGAELIDFDGESVQGAWNCRLYEGILDQGGYGGEHSDVHLWYLGTIDLTNSAAEADIDRGTDDDVIYVPDNWYTEDICFVGENGDSYEMGPRAEIGYNYTRLGGRSHERGNLTEWNIEDKTDDKIAPTAENYPIEILFNGDFEFNDLFLGRAQGWAFHVGRSKNTEFRNLMTTYCDTFTWPSTSAALHNTFYIPEDATRLSFKWKIENDSVADVFSVMFLPLPLDASEGALLYESTINGFSDWNSVNNIPIEDLRGKVGVLHYGISPDGDVGDSAVSVDNIRLIRSGIPIPDLPVQEAQIVGDLTPTFQWHVESPPNGYNGHQLRVQSNTEGITVYDTGYISGLGMTHTYNPGAYNEYDAETQCQEYSLPLNYGYTYHWHVRYRDNYGNWSPWSADVSGSHRYFYTIAPANNDPVLSSPTVTPESGDIETDFEFTVHYYDQDGDVPQYVKVYINGVSRTMQFKSGTGTEADGVYSYATTLPPVNYSFKFEARDVENGFAETDYYSGPTVAGALVPDVTGMTRQDAEEAILAAGLAVGPQTSEYSDTVPAGCVISQDPAPGSVPIGSEITLVISLGEDVLGVVFSSQSTDFNNDGMADLLWRQTSTGKQVIQLMNGLQKGPSKVIGADPDWPVVGLGDFNNDGMADLLWRQTSTGKQVVQLMNGLQKGQSKVLGANKDWPVVGLGDFNNDGMADLLWRQTSTGKQVIQLMNGLQKGQSKVLGANKDWPVVFPESGTSE